MDSFPNVKLINDEKSTFLGEQPTCNEKDERKLSKDAGDALSQSSQSVTEITRPFIEKNLPQIISVQEGEQRFKNIGDQLHHHSMKEGKDLSSYKSQSKPAEYSNLPRIKNAKPSQSGRESDEKECDIPTTVKKAQFFHKNMFYGSAHPGHILKAPKLYTSREKEGEVKHPLMSVEKLRTIVEEDKISSSPKSISSSTDSIAGVTTLATRTSAMSPASGNPLRDINAQQLLSEMTTMAGEEKKVENPFKITYKLKTIYEDEDFLLMPPNKRDATEQKRYNLSRRVSTNSALKNTLSKTLEKGHVRFELDEVSKLVNEMFQESYLPRVTEKQEEIGKLKTFDDNVDQGLIQSELDGEGFMQRLTSIGLITLNSPAKKMSRMAKANGAAPRQQYNGMTIKSTGTTLKVKRKTENGQSVSSEAPKTEKIPTKTATEYLSCQVSNKRKFKPFCGPTHTKPEANFVCQICKGKFRIKSLLQAHKLSHQFDRATAFVKRSSPLTLPLSLPSPNQCEYCERKFALRRTLETHLLQYCLKIPPPDKRRLKLAKQNDERTQPSNVFFNKQRSNSASIPVVSRVPRNVKSPRVAFKTTTEFLADNKHVNKQGMRLDAPFDKTIVPEADDFSTTFNASRKLLSCYLCDKTFQNAADYTAHSLSAHNNSTSPQTNAMHPEYLVLQIIRLDKGSNLNW
uniref:C2H2-type domain-containing protein n=1 Tax=Glossina austeni TaxID=7395 RepID=A0A1A9UFE9_GLOAU